MNRKNWIRLGLLAAVLAATSVLISCGPAPVSIEQRISTFVTSLNGSRTDTYTNIDPASPGYSLTANAAYWNTLMTGTTGPYTYPAPNTSNASSVTVVVTGASGPSHTFLFAFVNIGAISANWVIEHMSFDSVSQF
jgi:hypothetical protein